MSGTTDPERWEVFRAKIPTSGGAEEHYVVVVSRTEIVRNSRYVHVVPIDSDERTSRATRAAVVPLSTGRNPFLERDSFAMCHWLLRIDKERVAKGKFVGRLSETDQRSVRVAIELVLGTREP